MQKIREKAEELGIDLTDLKALERLYPHLRPHVQKLCVDMSRERPELNSSPEEMGAFYVKRMIETDDTDRARFKH